MKNLVASILVWFSIAAGQPAFAAPAIWEVRDDDSRIWLFGSIHTLPEAQDWRTPTFEKILTKADRVFFEVIMTPQAAATITDELVARGYFMDGRLLTDVLDDAQEARLRTIIGKIGLSIEPVLTMRPWLAAQSLNSMALQGFQTLGPGVELQLMAELPERAMGELETAAQQIDAITMMSIEEEVDMFMTSVEGLPDLTESMESIFELWVAGEAEALHVLAMEEMGGFGGATDRLLLQRNRSWVVPLTRLLDNGEQVLVVVGAAHLLGREGLIELLDIEGYQIDRVQ